MYQYNNMMTGIPQFKHLNDALPLSNTKAAQRFLGPQLISSTVARGLLFTDKSSNTKIPDLPNHDTSSRSHF